MRNTGRLQKLVIPTLENVAAAFLHTNEFFPTPEKIIFPLQFIISSTASAKELAKLSLFF